MLLGYVCFLLSAPLSLLRTEAAVPACQMLEIGQRPVTQWLNAYITCAPVKTYRRGERAAESWKGITFQISIPTLSSEPHFKDKTSAVSWAAIRWRAYKRLYVLRLPYEYIL